MQTRIQLTIFEADKDKLFDMTNMVEEALEEALAHLPFPVLTDVFPSEPGQELWYNISMKRWIVAYDADGETDICRHIMADTREEAEKELANQVNLEFCTNVDMFEDTLADWGQELWYNISMMKLKGPLKLDKVYDVDGTDMYGVLLQDQSLDDVVDELNCLMEYIRVLHDKVEEQEKAYEELQNTWV